MAIFSKYRKANHNTCICLYRNPNTLLSFSASLAYLAAATHGLQDEAEQLETQLNEQFEGRHQEGNAVGLRLPTVDPDAKLLVPPPPVQQVSKMLFRSLELHHSYYSVCEPGKKWKIV